METNKTSSGNLSRDEMDSNFTQRLVEGPTSEKESEPVVAEPDDPTFGTGIVGGRKIKTRRQKGQSKRIDKESDSYIVSTLIMEQAPNGEEFLTTKIGEKYRNLGKTTNSLSGQLYAKKQAGLLINRPANETEIETFGKVKVWHATDKFYEYMESVEQLDRKDERNDKQ